MAFTFDLGDVIAALALAASVWAILKTDRFNRRQNAFQKTADQLNQLLIDKEAQENQAQRRADIGVTIYKIGKSDYRMKIFNKGKANATNVTIEEVGDGRLLMPSDIQRKFPAALMEPQQSIELHVIVHFGSPAKTQVQVTWDDAYGQGQQKLLHPTL